MDAQPFRMQLETDSPIAEACAPEARVSSYLEALDEGERSARRGRMMTIGAAIVLAAVGFLTSIGVVPTEASELVAAGGAVSFVLAIGGRR